MVSYNVLCKHWLYSAVSACQLRKEENEKNFAQSGTHVHVAEFSKDSHKNVTLFTEKELEILLEFLNFSLT